MKLRASRASIEFTAEIVASATPMLRGREGFRQTIILDKAININQQILGTHMDRQRSTN